MSFDLFQYLFSLGLFYTYSRLLLHYGVIFIYFMLDQGGVWKPKSEKPGMLFILVGLLFMHLMIYVHGYLGSKNYLLQVIMTAVFGLGFFFSQITWTKKFESSFELKKSRPQQKNNNFEFKISEIKIQQLYNELVRYDLVQQDKTSFLDFKNVFTKDWNSHSSKIYLKMDGPSCREFYDCLVRNFSENSMTLKKFTSSKMFIRPDGKYYNYSTLKNAPTKTAHSKIHKDLKQIFDKIRS